jgi:hypothetical protein
MIGSRRSVQYTTEGALPMDIVSLLIQMIAGAAGGNIAGGLMQRASGWLGNSLAGVIGGALGGEIVNAALGPSRMAAAGALDVGTIISTIAASGLGGAVIAALVGLLRSLCAR